MTLEADIADRLRAEVILGKESFKQIVNGALRRGLGLEEQKSLAPFRVIPHSAAFLPGLDSGKLNQLVDELEAAEFLQHHRRA